MAIARPSASIRAMSCNRSRAVKAGNDAAILWSSGLVSSPKFSGPSFKRYVLTPSKNVPVAAISPRPNIEFRNASRSAAGTSCCFPASSMYCSAIAANSASVAVTRNAGFVTSITASSTPSCVFAKTSSRLTQTSQGKSCPTVPKSVDIQQTPFANYIIFSSVLLPKSRVLSGRPRRVT
jgi:hypothetical protein